jgi:precorrin-2 dehydrogenase / sirohydrochlorin ferrochelatase
MATGAAKIYYPVFLALEGRPCLVVGGGSVAEGKVRGLMSAGARVTVVSPTLGPALRELADDGRLRYVDRPYRQGDIDGMTLVLTATDDAGVNGQVTQDCRSLGTWVNSADDPPNCDFILPSVIRRGRVTLAASTSGASPALARRLREELEAFLGDDVALLADLLADVRSALQAAQIAVEPAAWQQAIDARLRALLAQGRYEEARERLMERLSCAAKTPAASDRESTAEAGECSR